MIYHRDLKAGNIVLTSDGVIKICDFGLAKDLKPEAHIPDRTKLSYKVGTFGYKAPELINGDHYGPEVDIWSIGIILHWICSKKRWFVPFDGETDAKYYDRVRYE